MENTRTKEEFIKSSLEIFDGNFMIDEDVERRAVFKKHPEVLAFLEKAYALDGDKKTVDFCLEAMWEDMTERGEI